MPSDMLTALWQQYHERLLNYVRGRLAVPDEAQDVVQAIFLKVYQHPPPAMAPPELEYWLWRVTKNAVIDHWRKHRAVPPFTSIDEDWQEPVGRSLANPSGGKEDENPWLNMGCCFLAMIKDLPDKYRETIDLADLQQRPYKDIALSLGLTESAVKSRVKRGREKLRDQLVQCCGGDCHCSEADNVQPCCHSSPV